MSDNKVVLRFSEVDYRFSDQKTILEGASFSVRKGSKVTLMGQNGAGKSTLFKLIMGELKPEKGRISLDGDGSVAIARQVFNPEEKELTLRAYLETAFDEVPYNMDKLAANIFAEFGLENYDMERAIKTYSGGQQARILLAYALIQDPDILLLDEPTNNLDETGIGSLVYFLMMHEKTCIVISHDADFLNSFSDGVLYLDVYTHQVEQYSGDYYSVIDEIAKRVEKEEKLNARMSKQIKDQKDKINFFANKGGKMRKLASKLRDQVADAEDSMVDVRREDRTIRPFTIESQRDLSGAFAVFPQFSVMESGEPIYKDIHLEIRKGDHIQLAGPNGIGKTTLLNALAHRSLQNAEVDSELIIGYYTQDFHNLDFDKEVRVSLIEAMGLNPEDTLSQDEEQTMRATAAGFLIDKNIIGSRIGDLSEGQKGLVAFAHLVLQKPGLMILDEPTNHINFRHIPVIAKALDAYKGGMILVSHVPEFVSQIRVDKVIDLDKL